MSFPLVIHESATNESCDRQSELSLMDQEEFRAFYERTARPLWSYLSRTTGNPQCADDFLQEAYYRFYRAGARHESEAHRRNSLFQIATNLVRDAARKTRNFQVIPLEEDETSSRTVLLSEAPVPERQAAIRTDLSRALNQLEPVQRELLWLAYAQGASHREIAEVLGLRAISIRTMLLRARRKLAVILNGGPLSDVMEGRR
ncbi:MAG TPA: RNA polymerase sigma factor [Thermoanaerobaculia bacterium]|nr:RNA polymerase sigma factor [Thermoanaerobaculia bacterium]